MRSILIAGTDTDPQPVKKTSPQSVPWPNIRLRRRSRPFMKAKIIITPKKAVVDPQGITVKKALEHMGYNDVAGVHIGKYIELDLAPGTDKAAAHKAIDAACHKLLSNPIIEDYKLEIE